MGNHFAKAGGLIDVCRLPIREQVNMHLDDIYYKLY